MLWFVILILRDVVLNLGFLLSFFYSHCIVKKKNPSLFLKKHLLTFIKFDFNFDPEKLGKRGFRHLLFKLVNGRQAPCREPGMHPRKNKIRGYASPPGIFNSTSVCFCVERAFVNYFAYFLLVSSARHPYSSTAPAPDWKWGFLFCLSAQLITLTTPLVVCEDLLFFFACHLSSGCSTLTASLVGGEDLFSFFLFLVSSAQHPQSQNRSQGPGQPYGRQISTLSIQLCCTPIEFVSPDNNLQDFSPYMCPKNIDAESLSFQSFKSIKGDHLTFFVFILLLLPGNNKLILKLWTQSTFQIRKYENFEVGPI